MSFFIIIYWIESYGFFARLYQTFIPRFNTISILNERSINKEIISSTNSSTFKRIKKKKEKEAIPLRFRLHPFAAQTVRRSIKVVVLTSISARSYFFIVPPLRFPPEFSLTEQPPPSFFFNCHVPANFYIFLYIFFLHPSLRASQWHLRAPGQGYVRIDTLDDN